MSDEFPKRISKWAQVQALMDEGRLTTAELLLIEAAQTGEWADVDTTVPTAESDAVLIHAALIRYLALGGCKGCEVAAEGVQVRGAWIAGEINLSYAKAVRRLALLNCHIANKPILLQSTIPALHLNGSEMPNGLNAQGAQIAGNVFLREVVSDGEISLSGATVGGQLSCVAGQLRDEEGFSLNAQRAQIAGSIFLDKVVSDGEIRLSGATIGGQLVCEGAKLRNEGGVR